MMICTTSAKDTSSATCLSCESGREIEDNDRNIEGFEHDSKLSRFKPSSSNSSSYRDSEKHEPSLYQPGMYIFNIGNELNDTRVHSKNSFNKVKLQQTDDTESITNSSDDDQPSKSFCDELSTDHIVPDIVKRESNNDEDDGGYGFYHYNDDGDQDTFTLVSNMSACDHDDHARTEVKMTSPLSILFNAEKISINQSSRIDSKSICMEVENHKLHDFMSILAAKCQQNVEHRVLFSYVNEKSSVVCRSFSRLSRSNSNLETQEYDHITASMQGFRIVQTTSGSHHAEFIISVYINDRNFRIWKRYSEFKEFADILFDEIEDPSYVEDYEERLYKARQSWLDVLNSKSWFRNLSILYLIKKSLKLEEFLRFAVWGMNTIEPFFQFLIGD